MSKKKLKFLIGYKVNSVRGRMIELQNVLVEQDCSNKFLMIFYINEYVSFDDNRKKNAIDEFIHMWENKSISTWKNLDDKLLFNFFCSYIVSKSSESSEIKKTIRNFRGFDTKIIKEYDNMCKGVFNYIVKYKIIVSAKLISVLDAGAKNKKEITKYIEMLYEDERNIIKFIKFDENIDARKDRYSEEFFRYIIFKSSSEIQTYSYLEKYLSREEKEIEIEKLCSEKSNKPLDAVWSDKKIGALRQIRILEKDEYIKEIIDNKIETLSKNRTQQILSGEIFNSMEKTSYSVDVPREKVTCFKKTISDTYNILHMFLIVPFKSIKVSPLFNWINLVSIDANTGLTLETVEDNAAKKYFEENFHININMRYLNIYKMICNNQLGSLISYCSLNELLDDLNEVIVEFFSETTNTKFDNYFIFSMAGCLCLINCIENIIKDIHGRHYETKNDFFEMLLDLTNSNYITDDELFFINYLIFDKNGLSLRNNFAHGNFKFSTGNVTYIYPLFLVYIIFITCESRKEYNE